MHPTAPLETWCKDEERRDECYHLVESPAVNWSEAHSVCTDVPDLTLSSGEDTSFLSQWMYLNHTDDDDTYTVWISGKWSEQQDNWFTVEGQPTIGKYTLYCYKISCYNQPTIGKYSHVCVQGTPQNAILKC